MRGQDRAQPGRPADRIPPGVVVCLLLALWVPALAEARDIPVEFERVAGLPDPRVSDFAEDRTGFLWLASASGLLRFDGHEFKRYGPVAGDPHSLSGARTRRVLFDRDGTLWVTTWFDGLNHFDPRSERFTRYRHDPDDPRSLSDDELRGIALDSKGTLWVGTGSGLDRFDRSTRRFARIRHDPENPRSLSHPRVEDILEDWTGTFWVATYGGGLNMMVSGRKTGAPTFVHFRHDPGDPGSLSHDRVTDLYEDRSGSLWIATWGGGLDQLDREAGRFRHHRHDPRDAGTLPSDRVLTVLEDEAGALWVVTPGHLSSLDPRTGRFARHAHDPDDARGLPGGMLGAIYEDSKGSLWVGSYGGGLSVWHPGDRLFAHHRHEPGNKNSLLDNVVITAYADRAGDVWIGTSLGISRLDPRTWRFTHFRPDSADPASLSAGMVTSVLEDRAGDIWVGTAGGLNRWSRRSGTFTRYLHDPEDPTSLSEDTVLALAEDRRGSIWVGTGGMGLTRLDPRTGTFATVSQGEGASIGDKVHAVYRDRSGVIWVGSETGLHRINPVSGQIVHYAHDPSNPGSIGAGVVHDIHQDRSGTLWCAADALYELVPGRGDEGDRFTRHPELEDLELGGIRTILEDDEGRLWISSARAGLFRFDPTTGALDRFDHSDGLHGQTAFSYGATRNRDGRMYFGGDNGFAVFHPDDIRLNRDVPPVVITDFRINHEPVPIREDSVLTRTIVETREITLSPEDRIISFEFAALDYRAPQRHRYRYTLEGFEDTWRDTDATRRVATYTNLDPGEYTFRVVGSNNHGVWNEEGAAIHITVNPAWWQTWWFRALAVGLIGGLVVMAYKLRLKYVVETNLRLEEEIEERKVTEAALIRSEQQLHDVAGRIVAAQEDERRRVARELHDDVNQRLAMLAVGAGMLVKRPPDTRELMAEKLNDLKQKLVGVSQQVRTVSRQLHPAELEHLGLAQALRRHCDELNEQTDIGVQLTVPEADLSMPWETAIVLYRIGQEALRNALKHSAAETVRVTLTQSDGDVRLSIADDGKGFEVKAVRPRGGLGLTSMEERVRLLGGELHVDSAPGGGTEITAEAPLGETYRGSESS